MHCLQPSKANPTKLAVAHIRNPHSSPVGCSLTLAARIYFCQIHHLTSAIRPLFPSKDTNRDTHHSNQNHQAAGAGRGRGSWAAGNGHGGGRRRDHDDEGAAAPPLLPLLLRHLPPRSVPVSAAFPVRSPSSGYPVSPNLRSLSPRSRGQAADCRRRQGQAGAKPAQHARRFSVPCHFWGMGLVGWRFLKC